MYHDWLGQPGITVVKAVLASCNKLTKKVNEDDSMFCVACCKGKIHNLPYLSSTTTYNNPLKPIHLDYWGPSPIESMNGYRYYIHFVDHYSRFTWIYLLHNKSKAFKTFLNFKTKVELQTRHKVKVIQTYCGGEFGAFTSYLTDQGIEHRVSCLHPHQQNGMAEGKYRHVVETRLTPLARASMPINLWNEVFRTDVYLIIKLPTLVQGGKCPKQVLYKASPDYSTLRCFFCACFPNMKLFNRYKLDLWSKLYIFLGCSINHKGYNCLDSDGKIIIYMNVLFDECSFPYASLFPSASHTTI